MPLLPRVPISCWVIHVLVISHVCKSLFSSAEMETMSKEKNPEQISLNIVMKQKKPLNFFMYKNTTETVKSKALTPSSKSL